jgi:hypothetical protein
MRCTLESISDSLALLGATFPRWVRRARALRLGLALLVLGTLSQYSVAQSASVAALYEPPPAPHP